MGNWKIRLSESTSKDLVLATINPGLAKYYAGQPRVDLGHFSPSLQNSLKGLAAYLMGQSSDAGVNQWVVSQFPRHQTQPLQWIFHDKVPIDEAITALLKNHDQSQTPEARYHAQNLNRARGLFASLLEITTVDNINIFGNALFTSDRNSLELKHVSYHLRNLREAGTFDGNLSSGFYKVLSRDRTWGVHDFKTYFGKVDIVKFSQEYEKPDLALDIIKAMGDASVVRDALYRALA
ncbi:hypothetical protein BDV33DRAFT_198397 [Aspergillus novoparasiticus]|uniref:Uncharacterized protein n=1 Tax=Aspergillus novoparasiticus TaxID=986946 RepID=A0A5N6F945_9EURO|nr:hypothetical protein BDV33DRAFT_198397 [Aspergillus novoparasiticus]